MIDVQVPHRILGIFGATQQWRRRVGRGKEWGGSGGEGLWNVRGGKLASLNISAKTKRRVGAAHFVQFRGARR